MKISKKRLFLFLAVFIIPFYFLMAQTQKSATSDQLMVRIAALEVDSNNLEEYLEILKEEAAASIKLESGVISIFPMIEKENPTTIKILEIYANRAAYESHLQTPHFLKYKTLTLPMVKSLKLIEMTAVDSETMKEIFQKSGF